MPRNIVVVLVLALTTGLLLPGAPAAAASSSIAELEEELGRIVNRERAAHGLPHLEITLQQQRKAREHSQVMADQQDLHHAPNLSDEVFPGDAWTGMAENIVRRRTVEAAHRAFMDSPPHRRNVLGDWTHVGIGIARDGDDLWITQRFIGIRPGRELPLFTDMPQGGWKQQAVADGWRAGILAGCGNDRACPDGRLSRDQTASLLARVLDLEPDPAAARRFTDVHPDSVHAGAIGALAAEGVTLGCRDDGYCPAEAVSRAATASLISRSLGWQPLLVRHFEDVVVEHTHAGSINRLAERRITDGCSNTHYCPSREVTRAEAAALLSRAF